MQRHDWERLFREHMEPNLAPLGYTFASSLHQFRRVTPFGFSCYILSFSVYEDACIGELHVGIRHDAVENMVFRFTNGVRGFQPDCMTLVTPLAKLKGLKRDRVEIQEMDAVKACACQWLKDIQEHGQSFVEECSTLAQLDALLNATPLSPVAYIHNQTYRCFRGLVVAHLNQRRDLPALVQTYRKSLQTRATPEFVLQRFDVLSQFLLQYSLN